MIVGGLVQNFIQFHCPRPLQEASVALSLLSGLMCINLIQILKLCTLYINYVRAGRGTRYDHCSVI